MSVLNKEQCVSLAKHAIGLDYKKPYKRHGKSFYKPYRNYYDASADDCNIWNEMCESGYCALEVEENCNIKIYQENGVYMYDER